MKWLKYTVHTTTTAEDLVADLLTGLGVEGVEIEDNVPLTENDIKWVSLDLAPDYGPDDGTAKVSFYLEEGTPAEKIEDLLTRLQAGLADLSAWTDVGDGQITAGETEDKDWMNNWKAYFKPFLVDDIVIRPTWEEVPAGMEGRLTLQIDPGMAFGTGSHETTQLILRQLEKYVTDGARVLDVGTGSGILSIAALKLGASFAFGTDVDENTAHVARENAQANEIPEERFPVVIGNILDDEDLQMQVGLGCYDIVAANILAPVIKELIGEADRHLKQGGIFITSGILTGQGEEILAAFKACPVWEILESQEQGEWVSFTARKR